MKELQHGSTAAAVPVDDERWALVQRVAASPQFARSARMRQFLLYVCDRGLRGKLDEISEQRIGSAVFSRAEDYDTTSDNIVRVEARNLRNRLEDYFKKEGRAESTVITVPKGGYVPVFEPRVQAATAAAEPNTPAVQEKTGRTSSWLPWALAAVLLLICAALALTLLRTRTVETVQAKPISDPLWGQLFDERHQTFVVTADSNLALVQDLTGKSVSLEQYIGAQYLEHMRSLAASNPLDAQLPLIASRQHTSVADVSVTGKILQLNYRFSDRTTVRFARNLQIRDFRSNNAILLGSVRSNPWVTLFEPSLNFIFDYDPEAKRPLYRNKSPKPGESAVYKMGGADGASSDAYGVVALLPNLAKTGYVLLIAGVSMEGTEAAGDFITNPDLVAKLGETMGLQPGTKFPPFEVLLKLRSVGGSSSDTRVLAYRLLSL